LRQTASSLESLWHFYIYTPFVRACVFFAQTIATAQHTHTEINKYISSFFLFISHTGEAGNVKCNDFFEKTKKILNFCLRGKFEKKKKKKYFLVIQFRTTVMLKKKPKDFLVKTLQKKKKLINMMKRSRHLLFFFLFLLQISFFI
jgi:hypothetical protein